ncbi:MAG: TonB-dependent receptor [Bryobacterales bacterium]|nr:TonB-dependent receptor [Bryobacterales bacterium]
MIAKRVFVFFFASVFLTAAPPPGQATGVAGTVTGTVTDPSGATVALADVEIRNRATGFVRNVKTDNTGAFKIIGVPPNNYHVVVSAAGFQPAQQDVNVRSSVPLNLDIKLSLAAEATTMNVSGEAADLVENVPSAHTDIDSSTFNKLPTSSPGGGLSDAITMATPGVVADSNGFFHPIGDHAQTGFSVDNQPITDQQSKLFSTSMPLNAFASMEVIAGAPTAEYGDKTSLIVNAITRSGLGAQKPFGSLSLKYGSFGTIGEDFTEGFGNGRFGNFLAANTVRSGRYLDTPEFAPLHDRGNNQTIFDRVDFQPTSLDSLHLNLFFSRAWFQIPNTYDQQTAGQDQRQQIRTYNIAPGWVHTFGSSTVLTVNPYFRHDESQFFPSRNPFSDVPATLSQLRTLGNLGVKADLSYVHGAHNIKGGVQVQHTFLEENFSLGITDPAFDFSTSPGLLPYDLNNHGSLFRFRGHTDVKEEGYYLQDSITLGAFNIQAGLRYDQYNGLVADHQLEPRLGVSYLYKPTGTVVRLAYGRFFETPYNENLILSSATGAGGLATNTFSSFGSQPLRPGKRDQYNAGFEQAIGKHFSIDASYIWKYTRNGFDFDNLFNTPLAFPINWRKSKIDGLSMRFNLAEYKGLSAYTTLGHTRARFFGPEIGGLIFNSPLNNSVFRIDHDEALQQTTNVRYQRPRNGPWIDFTWRYDSGLVAGRVPDLASAFSLTGDQQAAIQFHCGGTYATINNPITSCAGLASANLLRIPAPGTENDDTNPPRMAPRNLFDVGVGIDDIFHAHKDRPRFTARFTAVNLTNKVALYNFLSTFSGTHFVEPRGYTVELGMVW